jgi:NAD(P)-dependent dehydrogenase (short-subunit alcohol dehydrogenase family)
MDTWVNNAAVSMYGRIMDVSIEDMRRQMDVNYWGQVYGSRTAVKHLRPAGGAFINVGSALSDRAIPLQGGYCAAKHALKAFTDALRMELEEQGSTIRSQRMEASEDEIGKVIRERAACIHAPHCIHARRLRSSRQWRSASGLS